MVSVYVHEAGVSEHCSSDGELHNSAGYDQDGSPRVPHEDLRHPRAERDDCKLCRQVETPLWQAPDYVISAEEYEKGHGHFRLA